MKSPLIFLDDSVIVTKKITLIRGLCERFSKHGKYSIEIFFIGSSKKDIIFEEKEDAKLKLQEILDVIEDYVEINNTFIPLNSVLCIFNTRQKVDKKYFFGVLLPLKHYVDFKFDCEKESEKTRKELLNRMSEYYEKIYK